MIKRSGAFALTILYTITIMGFALNLHYCFNHITSIKINAQVKSCGMLVKSKMKCCQNKHFEVKVKDAHQGQSQSVLSKLFGFELPDHLFANCFFAVPQAIAEKGLNRGPPHPPLNSHVSFIKNCVFRI
jgi:hypothetical protein